MSPKYEGVAINKWAEDLQRVRPATESTLKRLNEEPQNGRDAAWQEAVRRNLAASSDLNVALQDVGVPFMVGELARVKAAYPEALPVLTKFLASEDLSEDVYGAILRAMTVPYGGEEAFQAVLLFLRRHRSTASESLLYEIGNALAVIARKGQASDLLQLAKDLENKQARSEPLLRLAKWADRRIEPIASGMLESNDQVWYALRAARLAKIHSALPFAQTFACSENPEIAKEAKAYLNALGAKG